MTIGLEGFLFPYIKYLMEGGKMKPRELFCERCGGKSHNNHYYRREFGGSTLLVCTHCKKQLDGG